MCLAPRARPIPAWGNALGNAPGTLTFDFRGLKARPIPWLLGLLSVSWRGPSALAFVVVGVPGALPQAGIVCAVGARPTIDLSSRAEVSKILRPTTAPKDAKHIQRHTSSTRCWRSSRAGAKCKIAPQKTMHSATPRRGRRGDARRSRNYTSLSRCELRKCMIPWPAECRGRTTGHPGTNPITL